MTIIALAAAALILIAFLKYEDKKDQRFIKALEERNTIEQKKMHFIVQQLNFEQDKWQELKRLRFGTPSMVRQLDHETLLNKMNGQA